MNNYQDTPYFRTVVAGYKYGKELDRKAKQLNEQKDWEELLAPCISPDRTLWPAPLRTLPSKFQTLRPNQIGAIVKLLRGYEAGNEVMILDAPPGSGKTVIAEVVRRMLAVRGLYICHTKSLQDQFASDFDCAVLKGRSNYPTLREDLFHGPAWTKVTAADCTKHSSGEDRICTWCDDVSNCPYERAKAALLRAELGVINTSYFLTESNYVGRLSRSEFVVVDECDTLESELMGFVGVEISEGRVKEYGLGTPERVTKEDSWIEWATTASEAVGRHLKRYNESEEPTNVRGIKQRNYLSRLADSLARLTKSLGDGSWVYTGRSGEVAFKPIRVTDLGQEYIWQHSNRWLLMSGTVISPSELMASLGGSELRWDWVGLDSIFKPENRQVKVIQTSDMSKKGLDNDRRGQIAAEVEAISKIIARHPGERMLVHTVSYDLANDLALGVGGLPSELRPDVYCYGSAAERDNVLRSFTGLARPHERTSTTRASVLFAPSMDRGIDLPDDLCRVIVIAKVPYPYLGDRQVAARLYSYGGQTWYNVQTVRKIVQMTGRGVRNENDYCTTYILDKNFYTGIWTKNRKLFPRWWVEGLDWKDKL